MPSLTDLNKVPSVGSHVRVKPSDIRWTHDKLQRLFTCGRSLAEVATQLQQGVIHASALPSISSVYHEGKWYSRNNRRLWSFKTANISVIDAIVTPVDNHFCKGLTTRTDGWSVEFYPPCLCNACGKEFPNRAIQWRCPVSREGFSAIGSAALG